MVISVMCSVRSESAAFARNRALSFVVYVTHQKVASVLVAVNDCDVLVHNKRLFGVTLMN